jgi:hypothetical protein
VKVIALDLDGTLVKTGVLEIAPADREAIGDAVRAGTRVILASARTPAQIRQFQAELGLDGPAIGNNGSLVELAEGVELLHRRIEAECARRIVSALVEAELYPNVIRGNEIIRRRRPDERAGRETTRVAFCEYAAENVDDLLPWLGGGVTQIGVLGRPLEATLDALATEPVRALRYFDADVLSGAIFVHTEASKGDALTTVLRYLGIDPADTLAVGDSEADLPMFAVAGHAVAVANAAPAVRTAAEWIAPAQWEAGVAAAIRRFL